LFNEAPLSVGIGDVNRVVIIDKGSVVEFSRDKFKKDDIFTLAGKPVKKEDFITLYINLMALSSEGYDSGNTGKVPELTIVFELKNRKNTKAAFSRRDEHSYFINVDGKPHPFYVGARKIELVRKWLNRIELP
jgi:ribosomal protein L31